jgi:DNA modification methylase
VRTQIFAADSLIPYIRNPRKNSAAVDKVAASIKEYGWQQPIVVDKENVIIAGHTRLLAAQKLGMDKVPVHVADLSDAQAKAYRLADNRISEDADWDMELLGLEIRELDDLDFNLDLTGFDNTELANLLIDSDLGETDEDAVPEPPEEPISKPGDLWELGEHRVLCGDATKKEDVERLMDGQQADMVFTDPPYGVAYEQGKFTGLRPKKKFEPIKNDEKTGDDLYRFISDAFRLTAESTKPSAPCYCWSPPLFEGFEIARAVRDAGFKIQSQLIWNKGRLTLGRADYHWQHEVCWYGFKTKEPGHHWCGDRKQTTVWDQARDHNYDHPTQKPVELIERALNNSSKGGDVVLDLFGGSGSTLIACQKNGRKARLMELDPKYCDVIVKRWEEYTGEKAEVLVHE